MSSPPASPVRFALLGRRAGSRRRDHRGLFFFAHPQVTMAKNNPLFGEKLWFLLRVRMLSAYLGNIGLFPLIHGGRDGRNSIENKQAG